MNPLGKAILIFSVFLTVGGINVYSFLFSLVFTAFALNFWHDMGDKFAKIAIAALIILVVAHSFWVSPPSGLWGDPY